MKFARAGLSSPRLEETKGEGSIRRNLIVSCFVVARSPHIACRRFEAVRIARETPSNDLTFTFLQRDLRRAPCSQSDEFGRAGLKVSVLTNADSVDVIKIIPLLRHPSNFSCTFNRDSIVSDAVLPLPSRLGRNKSYHRR